MIFVCVDKEVMQYAFHCHYFEYPSCTRKDPTDIRGIMRRVTVGNFIGAKKAWKTNKVDIKTLNRYEAQCICYFDEGQGIQIREVIDYLDNINGENFSPLTTLFVLNYLYKFIICISTILP